MADIPINEQGSDNRAYDFRGVCIFDNQLKIPVSNVNPDNSNIPNIGLIRVNSDTNKLQFHNGTDWQDVATGAVSSDYIPLSGTTSGNPVTGYIVMADQNEINDATAKIGILFSTSGNEVAIYSNDGSSVFNVRGDYFRVNILDPTSRGLAGELDYTPNITDLDYVQKKFITGGFIPFTGTPEESPITGDLILNDLVKIRWNGEATIEAPSGLNLNTEGTNVIIGGNPTTLGLIALSDYSENNDGSERTIYPQTGWVQDRYKTLAISTSATVVSMPFLSNQYVYRFTGSTSVFTLPTIEQGSGKIYKIINRGSGGITLNSNSGGNDIDDGGVMKNTYVIDSGTQVTITGDSETFNIE